ncbi:MAG: hypothetical protein NVS3B12_14100 [Acidimicrobiales bacterium]
MGYRFVVEQLSGTTIFRALATIDQGSGGSALFDELHCVLREDGVTVPTALAELGSLGLVDGEDLPGPRGANGFVLRGLTPAARVLLRFGSVRLGLDPD